ncbi:uncharacterized protein LOC133525314 [Cydia pomonella]|uniref:uncharacterized protein LOC133525314 n=1 Tax=Cydia pomonella TaxID=82600 RepID=UPI002ADE5573|nr:uncharacterized protein LOC133525314 [Cydia pomonella]
MFGSEFWTTKKKREKKIHTNEMKMLRWAAGVTRLDRVRNEYVRGSFKVAPIAENMAESCMRWFGYVMRRDEEYAVKKALAIPEQKNGKGMPLTTWSTTVTKDMERVQINTQTTHDRKTWRLQTRRADPK